MIWEDCFRRSRRAPGRHVSEYPIYWLQLRRAKGLCGTCDGRQPLSSASSDKGEKSRRMDGLVRDCGRAKCPVVAGEDCRVARLVCSMLALQLSRRNPLATEKGGCIHG